MGDNKLGLGWGGGTVGGERGAGPASALANEKSPGPTVFTWRQRNGSAAVFPPRLSREGG